MDRPIIYPGAIPQDTDLLDTNQNVMVGLGFLMQAILGTGTLADGLACAPTTPASMSVTVASGSIYSLQSLEATAYGSLAADTTHQIVKQGIVQDSQTFSCPAPGTSGQSRVYLIEAAYQDVDDGPVVLPYYNASDPSQAYAGPNNSGVSQNTARRGVCKVQVKAGTAATTGTQITPSPTAGFTGLWAITVANGQTTITSGSIARVAGAPFIDTKLTSLAPLASPGLTGSPTTPDQAASYIGPRIVNATFVRNLGATVSAIFQPTTNLVMDDSYYGSLVIPNTAGITLTLPPVNAANIRRSIKFLNSQSTPFTIAASGGQVLNWGTHYSSAATIILQPGDAVELFNYDGSTAWIASSMGDGTIRSVKKQVFVGSGTYTPSAGMLHCNVKVLGGGGGGAGCTATLSAGGGGGSGAYAEGVFTAAQIGASKTVTIGAAGAGASSGSTTGSNGGTTSLGSLISATGGVGGNGGIGGSGGTTASGGQIGSTGGAGSNGIAVGPTTGNGGNGAASIFGGAGSGGVAPNNPGNPATAFGSGGGGACANSIAQAGGNGAAGIVVIEEYCSQ